ncbi:hypothetical protein FIV42_11300 [Persicimonas caeni]|uniref:Uncharacterized protein n=1 Tax=Persicimonas caeni TaxID=2292766 RepID=A0A4Y6PU58_PERCE|nr:hypothetical protein [Persicimonas caeni]QDG51305.1 hypothetical protein FIV42_11300 [Persicimonas caeni]QED32526.1 hypothetical protein FRD00_11295 [Persicimonas caeni]
MITLNNTVGRLITVTLASPITIDEVTAFQQELKQTIVKLGQKVVIAGDLRQLEIVPPDVGEALVGLMKSDNPHLERSGHLISNSVMSGMQVGRLLEQANSDARKAFKTPKEVSDFLGEVLSADEKAALDKFYG